MSTLATGMREKRDKGGVVAGGAAELSTFYVLIFFQYQVGAHLKMSLNVSLISLKVKYCLCFVTVISPAHHEKDKDKQPLKGSDKCFSFSKGNHCTSFMLVL